MVKHAVPVAVDVLADPTIFHVVEVVHHLRGRIAAKGRIGRIVADFSQAVSGIPRVLRDLRVSRGESAAVIRVDEPGGAVAFGIVRIRIRSIVEQPVVGPGGIDVSRWRSRDCRWHHRNTIRDFGIQGFRDLRKNSCADELAGRVVRIAGRAVNEERATAFVSTVTPAPARFNKASPESALLTVLLASYWYWRTCPLPSV